MCEASGQSKPEARPRGGTGVLSQVDGTSLHAQLLPCTFLVGGSHRISGQGLLRDTMGPNGGMPAEVRRTNLFGLADVIPKQQQSQGSREGEVTHVQCLRASGLVEPKTLDGVSGPIVLRGLILYGGMI